MMHVPKILFTACCLCIGLTSFAQSSNYSKVYRIFQANCNNVSCHDAVSPKANLSLEGTETAVYNKLVGVTPTNSFAQGKGYTRINPGDPHSSFLFRKINQGLDPEIVKDSQEGEHMPTAFSLTDEEKETIRQWILYGAMQNGTSLNSFDTLLVQDYYANGGIESMPTAPPAPAPAEGFQVHMGPYFVAPGQEDEHYLKYNPNITDSFEIYKIEIMMSNFSHHYIMNKLNPGEEGNFQAGYRKNGSTLSSEGIVGTQYADTVILPQNTAYAIPGNAWFDLNSHYINFSNTQVLKAEAYANIYTQPSGTAAQIMHNSGQFGSVSAPVLFVPNNGNVYSFESEFHEFSSPINIPSDVFIWQMTSHTHQWGIDFDIFKRNANGTRGIQIFDAEYLDANPYGTFIGYDYEHPPQLFFDPFLYTPKEEGFIFEASWVNNGPSAVGWGLDSEDEMFVMAMFYVLDTTGLSTGVIKSKPESGPTLNVYPNPFSTTTTFHLNGAATHAPTDFILLDLLGKEVLRMNGVEREFVVERGGLKRGAYIYKLMNAGTFLATGKLIAY
ncbi:MAG TPA: T9SS type A sorting domain-containing protein [Flavobacteriales bacterium]|nr:T9SS type A sorting domain-containing protein [Flavobacteriales bacterium]HIA12793.1 T9SS type A sorting domain-containing protein [Flavobacteriales bacterium]